MGYRGSNPVMVSIARSSALQPYAAGICSSTAHTAPTKPIPDITGSQVRGTVIVDASSSIVIIIATGVGSWVVVGVQPGAFAFTTRGGFWGVVSRWELEVD